MMVLTRADLTHDGPHKGRSHSRVPEEETESQGVHVACPRGKDLARKEVPCRRRF